MQLVERDALSLDDDVNKYLKFKIETPYYPNISISVRMLLCHRSSLKDIQRDWDLKQIIPKTNEKYKECYNDYVPGTKYEYCNMGYSILGAVIENVTGMRFDEFIDKNITVPLGLNASFNMTKIDSSFAVLSCSYNKPKKI